MLGQTRILPEVLPLHITVHTALEYHCVLVIGVSVIYLMSDIVHQHLMKSGMSLLLDMTINLPVAGCRDVVL